MNNAAPKFVTYFDFSTALPHSISRSQLLRLSKAKRFPEFVRPAGLQSEPLFLESEVKQWVADRYGKLLPTYVAQLLEREGFDVKPPLHGESVR
jgi:hypothetical protein